MIRVVGSQLRDEHGRRLLLRGVNLGGSSKVPAGPLGPTHVRQSLNNPRSVSFVGRPFPLDEADEHFARLRAWGLTLIRLLVPWEAVEHAGPGQYDREYLEYLRALVSKTGEHGLRLFIDPHQDCWSRFSGGDGAPGWTLEAVGMDLGHIAESGAAVLHRVVGDPFPRMIWPTNESKLASATMFTLFFAGDFFAPKLRIDGEPAQEYLQHRFIQAMTEVAQALRGLPQVIGYDTLNEPSPGYIGWSDLNKGPELRLGASPTPLQSMALGAGIPQRVGIYEMWISGAMRRGEVVVNPGGVSLWREGYDCPWRQHGVWDVDARGQPRLLRPDYFQPSPDKPTMPEVLRSFALRYRQAIRSVDPEAILFLEGMPGGEHPMWGRDDPGPAVHAAHWYDGLTLFTKEFRPYLAIDFSTHKLVALPWRVERSVPAQLARIQRQSAEEMGGIPTLISEVGIPFDMHGKQAYRTGDFGRQEMALDRSLKALDANLLSYTLWAYTGDNDNVHGDQWNGEDFSVFSRDQQADVNDVNSGGRALAALVRPYATAIAGEPQQMSYDYRRRRFRLEFEHDPEVSAPTEVFVPRLAYAQGCHVQASDGSFELKLGEQQLCYYHGQDRPRHTLEIVPADERGGRQ